MPQHDSHRAGNRAKSEDRALDVSTESYDANGLLVLTGKKSGEVLETGMTKSQADEMKRNNGF